MICKQCGNEIAPGSQFCGVCGATNTTTIGGQPIEDTQPQYAQPQYGQPAQPQYGQPVQPQPMRPQYDQSQPVQPQYDQPMQPQYGQPMQPQYGQPMQSQYGQPMQSQYGQPMQSQYGQPVQQAATPESQSLAKGILGFGIAAIICAWIPIVSILGIIFGAIAKGRAKTYDAMNYPSNGMRVTGKVLGLIGFIAGIIMTVYYSFYFIAILAVI